MIMLYHGDTKCRKYAAAHTSKSAKTGFALIAGLLLTSCSSPLAPVLGYRQFPNPCGLVQRATVARLVGTAGPKLGDFKRDPTDVAARSQQSCEWQTSASDATLGWGNFNVAVKLHINVLLEQYTNGAPDIADTKKDFQASTDTSPVPGKQVIGDESASVYRKPLGPTGDQFSAVTFRLANVEVNVEYSASGSNFDGTTVTPVTHPREQVEQVAHDVAQEALKALGPPQLS